MTKLCAAHLACAGTTLSLRVVVPFCGEDLALIWEPVLLFPQGPLAIGPGCLLSGLNVDSSAALRDHLLRDIVLQGHHIRLRDLPCRVFTLTGRLDDWQVRGQ